MMDMIGSIPTVFSGIDLGVEQKDGGAYVNARILHSNIGSRRDFTTWMKERIDRFGFIEGSDYIIDTVLSSPDSGSAKARPQVMHQYLLSLSMAKELALVENTDAGKRIRIHLIKIDEAWNRPEMVMARAIQLANKQIHDALSLVEELKPKAIVHDRICNADGNRLLSEVGKVNGIGPKKIFQLLCDRGIIYRGREAWLPKQRYQDAGYFITRDYPSWTDSNGVEHMRLQLYVTPKGEAWIAKQLFAEEGVRGNG